MSDDTAFTPGPWKWLNYPDGRKLLAAPSQAVIHCPDAPITLDEPDARLIAASPTMYAYILKKASEGDLDAAQIIASIGND